MAPIASVVDLEQWLGETLSNPVRADAILKAASTLIRTRTGRSWVDAAGEPLEDVTADDFDAVKTVCVQVAARVWLNPHGRTQQTTGPFSESVATWASLGLSFTEDEAAMLPRNAETRPALWTLATTRCDNDIPDIYLDVVGQEEQIVHVPQGSVNW